MKWIRKIGSLSLVMFLVMGALLPSVLAYTGGLLNGKTLNRGEDLDNTLTTITAVTDNNQGTYDLIYPSGGAQDTIWYKFSAPMTITDYQLKASTGSGLSFRLYDANKNQILSSANMLADGNKSNQGSIENVSYVAIVNTTAANITVYEFDVFGQSNVDTTPPANVNAVQYSSTEDQINISWTYPTDSDFSKVLILDGSNNQIGEVVKPNNTFTHSGLTAGTQYTYKLVSVDSNGNKSSGYTFSTYTLAPDVTPPAEVTNIVTTVKDDSIRISFTPPADSDFIEVRVFKEGVLQGIVSNPATYFQDYELTPNTTYTYLMRSRDTSGNMSSGVTVDVTTSGSPDIPSFLNVTSKQDVATLSWGDVSASDYNFVGYNVYQDGAKINTSPITSVVHQVSGLTFGQTYKFKVSSIDELGNESGFTREVSITPEEIKIPSKPKVNYRATESSLTLNWNPVNQAESYKIYKIAKDQSTALESLVINSAYAADPELVAETGGTSYTIENPDYNSNYAVAAVNEIGESDMATVSPTPSVEVVGSVSVPITGADVIINTIMLVGSLASIILLALCIYFAPRLIDLIKNAAS